ncbi:SAM-dependent methyltransferase [Bacteroidota bacterium]
MPGVLYLIPSPIADSELEFTIPQEIKNIINTIDYYIVENVRTARRYLSRLKIEKSIDELHFFTLNKHTRYEEIPAFLQPIKDNHNIGLISEAGVPCVADPGGQIVKIAHSKNIKTIPLVGPSSIILALMASGLNGQNFSFVGYLPINKNQKIQAIKQLEKRSMLENQTQILIETPYRNNHMAEDLVKTLSTDTLLCIASEITSEKEFIKTKTIKEWKKNVPDLNKKPTIFLLHKYK